MKLFNNIIFTFLLLVPSFAQSATLEELLKKVQQEGVTQSEEYKKREAEFIEKKNEQKILLQKATSELNELERETARLTAEFDRNEKELAKVEEELNMAMGTLGEMFGVVKQVAGDLKGQIENSVVSAQIKGRRDFASDLAESKSLPDIPKLERLWFELQREMTETGRTTRFKTTVVAADGSKSEQEVVRVGAFNLASDGAYLSYQSATDQVIEMARQPSSRFTSTIDDIIDAKDYEGFALDPSRGSLLAMLVNAPNFWERLQQGGLVGWVIIAILFLGLILVAERLKTLKTEGDKIRAQMNSKSPSSDNALGVVLMAYEENKNADLETLELKLDEAILKSTPKFERGNSTIKLLSSVAPLLGLLGTVTGMIQTFQSITLFGTGDPKLMAGGISQALVTTVEGLVCAIPLLLLHNVISNKSKDLVQILEEESAGLIAQRAEADARGSKG